MTSEPLPLAGRAALVTGGGSGIGLAIAARLLADGAHVTIAGRDEARLRTATEQLDSTASGHVGWSRCDVTVEHDVEAAVAAAEDHGDLSIVVASAGGGTMAPITALSREDWDSGLATNVTGSFLALKHAAPHLARAADGAFVAISSIAGGLSHRYLSGYAVAKSAVEALVRNAADELGHLGVRVNAVRPGLVSTDMGAAFERDPVVRADYLAQMPLGRVGTVDDVAALVRFLVGPEATWITGQIIGCDGGHGLRRGPDIEHWARRAYGDAAVEGTS